MTTPVLQAQCHHQSQKLQLVGAHRNVLLLPILSSPQPGLALPAGDRRRSPVPQASAQPHRCPGFSLSRRRRLRSSNISSSSTSSFSSSSSSSISNTNSTWNKTADLLRPPRDKRHTSATPLPITILFFLIAFLAVVPVAASWPSPPNPPPTSPNKNTTQTRQRRSPSSFGVGTVSTNSGLVQGSLIQLPNTNIEVYEFLGIPYAEPPIGERRFRKPVPKNRWEDILDATRKSNSCPQLLDTLFDTFPGATMWNANTNMSEDCLYLNIWVPRQILDDLNKGQQQSLHPVFIWIFGGGFTSGSATLPVYDGRVLAGYNNIIVASMQYRIGALGFLYFDTEDAPGNMGMWDQLMALKWTCENIHYFGGDCKNTTLFGESAGAASVSLHLLSPFSRDYFQRAIMQSASALSGWAVLNKEEALWRSNELVTKFTSSCAPFPSATSAGAEPSSQYYAEQMSASQNNFRKPNDLTRWKIDCLRSQKALRLPEEEWGVLASVSFL